MQIKQFMTPQLLAVFFMGFSSGLPLALTGSTLQAWFTEANINLVTIGAVSLLGIPYILKFLWAPVMDFFTLPMGKRGWTLCAQAALAFFLLILANGEPTQQTYLMLGVALLVAFFSASQDIAIDAYRAEVLSEEARGLGSAYFVMAYRLAVLITSGLALIAADYWGFKVTYEIMAALMLISMVPVWLAPSTTILKPRETNYFSAMHASLRDLLQRDHIVYLLLFIIFYKFGDALILQLMNTFLLRGLGFTLAEVGVAYKMLSFFATISGALVGGALLLRWHIFRALLLFGLAQAFSNLMFVLLAMVGKNFSLMAASIFIENFCSGLSTAAFMAFLMSLCHREYTAGQYALLSAVASIGRVFLGPFAGLFVKEFGWTQFFIWSFSVSFIGLLFLMLIKEKVSTYATLTAK
jgi:MFS transporter, PAT family, beta-lactamase induction signal transducer AmpG